MSVGVVDHEKSFCLYSLRFLSLGCAACFELLFPLQRGRSTLGKQLTGMCLVRVSVVSCFPLLSLWVSGVVVFTVVPWSPEKSPKESCGPRLVGACTGLVSDRGHSSQVRRDRPGSIPPSHGPSTWMRLVLPSTGLDDGLIGVLNRGGNLYREIVTPRCF